MTANAAYWIDQFHFDGLRLDATQQMYDTSEPHVLAELSARARAAAPRQSICLFAENEPQDTRILRSLEQGGYGFDALWNDDFHHSAMVALTGRREAYYQDYLGTAQEFLSMAKWGFLYQGQRYRGSTSGAARRHAAWRRTDLSRSWKTTIRSPTRLACAENGFVSTRVPACTAR